MSIIAPTNFSFPYLACDYDHESIAFVANGAAARIGKGIKDNEQRNLFSARINLKPNPIGDMPLNYELIVENNRKATGVILILDLYGRTIQNIKWDGALTGTLYLPILSEGIYSLVLKTESWIASERFVKL